MTQTPTPMPTPMPASATTRTRITVRPHPYAPRVVRRLVRQSCERGELPARVTDDAAVVAGELVTSSIRQVHTTMRVDVVVAPCEVTVRVHDSADPARVVRQPHSPGDTRSWEVVRRLAASFGYLQDDRARELWASLRVAHPAAVPTDP